MKLFRKKKRLLVLDYVPEEGAKNGANIAANAWADALRKKGTLVDTLTLSSDELVLFDGKESKGYDHILQFSSRMPAYDGIVAHTHAFSSIFGGGIRSLLDKSQSPLIYWVHCLFPDYFKFTGAQRTRRNDVLAQGEMMSLADRTVFLSENSRTLAVEYAGELMPTDPGVLRVALDSSEVIPNGVRVLESDPIYTDLVRDNLLGEGEQILLYYGRFEPYKGIQELARAFIMLKQDRPDLKLVMAGSPDNGADFGVQQMLTDGGLQDNGDFYIYEWKEGKELCALIDVSAAVIYPVQYDTRSNLPGEVALRRTPVVISDIPATRDVLWLQDPDSRLAWPITNLDARGVYGSIDSILNDLDRGGCATQAMVDRAYDSARLNSWDTVTGQLLDVIGGTDRRTRTAAYAGSRGRVEIGERDEGIRDADTDRLRKTSDPLVSIVVLSYERLEDTQRCIDSIRLQTTLPYEIVLLDNASGSIREDGTTAGLEEIERGPVRQYLKTIDGTTTPDGNGRIRVIFNDKNEGCSVGRRKATLETNPGSRYLIYLDNDMEVPASWDIKMVTRMEEDPELGAANAKLAYPDGTVQFTGCGFTIEDGYFFKPVYFDNGKGMADPSTSGEIYTPMVSGGATIFRRDVMDRVKHSRDYLNGFEDWDVALQIAALGYKLGNVDVWLTHHHIGCSSNGDREKVYTRDRQDSHTIFDSLLVFLERTGLNTIKPTRTFRELERSGAKQFLDKCGYTDLFPGQRLSELSPEQVRQQFDSILRQRREVGRTANGQIDMEEALRNCVYTGRLDISPRMSFTEIEQVLESEFKDQVSQSYGSYNRRILAVRLWQALEISRGESGAEGIYRVVETAARNYGNEGRVIVKDPTKLGSFAREIARRIYDPSCKGISFDHSAAARSGEPRSVEPCDIHELVEGYAPLISRALSGYNRTNMASSLARVVENGRDDEGALLSGLTACIVSSGTPKDRTALSSLANDMTAKIYASVLEGRL